MSQVVPFVAYNIFPCEISAILWIHLFNFHLFLWPDVKKAIEVCTTELYLQAKPKITMDDWSIISMIIYQMQLMKPRKSI